MSQAAETAWCQPGGWALGSVRDGRTGIVTALIIDDSAFDIAKLSILETPIGEEQTATVRSLLADWDRTFERLQRVVDDVRAAGVESSRWEAARTQLTALTILPPVQKPGQVFQSGANYRKHMIEMIMAHRTSDTDGMDEEELRQHSIAVVDKRMTTGTPYVFLGLPSAICGPYDDVVLPDAGSQHDWELELAAVIGRPAWHVPRDRAMEHIAGYTICNDLSTRDLSFRPDLPAIGTDWLRGKNWPTFLPTGPFLVPAQFVDPHDLQITLRLNGQVMQDENSSEMIFGIDRLIEYTTSIARLEPGDMVLTGSPAGNGAQWNRFLTPDDVMEAEISGLGRQRNQCIADQSHRGAV